MLIKHEQTCLLDVLDEGSTPRRGAGERGNVTPVTVHQHHDFR
jgi:hypothetical protein